MSSSTSYERFGEVAVRGGEVGFEGVVVIAGVGRRSVINEWREPLNERRSRRHYSVSSRVRPVISFRSISGSGDVAKAIGRYMYAFRLLPCLGIVSRVATMHLCAQNITTLSTALIYGTLND